jgi:hypothetical protein
MCRNIKKLRRAGSSPSETEIRDASLQFVRKVSGYHVPSQKNEKAFDRAVRGVTREVRKMFDTLGHPKNH